MTDLTTADLAEVVGSWKRIYEGSVLHLITTEGKWGHPDQNLTFVTGDCGAAGFLSSVQVSRRRCSKCQESQPDRPDAEVAG